MTMKITGFEAQSRKIARSSDLRIDFVAIAALIVLPQHRSLHTMPAEPPQLPVPLAEITQGPSAFELFLDRNQKNLVILAILVVLATAAFVVYSGIQKSSQQAAGQALSKAEDLAALQAVIQQHADTQAAHSAKILLADQQWDDGQQDVAIGTLRQFIATGSNHPALPTAQASLASKLMSQGKNPEAAEIFQNLVSNPKSRYIAPYALISLGDIAQVSGDLEKAETAYNRVKTDFADSNFLDTANRRISTLKAKAPVEIEPPPAPEPPTVDGIPPGISFEPPPDSGITITPEEQTEPEAAEPPLADEDSAPTPDENTEPMPEENSEPEQDENADPAPGETPAEPSQESAPETRNEETSSDETPEEPESEENP